MNLHAKVLDILTVGPPSLVITDRIRDNSNIHQHWPELSLNLEVCCVTGVLSVDCYNVLCLCLGAATAATVRNKKDLVS